jgi:hypothetical protein
VGTNPEAEGSRGDLLIGSEKGWICNGIRCIYWAQFRLRICAAKLSRYLLLLCAGGRPDQEPSTLGITGDLKRDRLLGHRRVTSDRCEEVFGWTQACSIRARRYYLQ